MADKDPFMANKATIESQPFVLASFGDATMQFADDKIELMFLSEIFNKLVR